MELQSYRDEECRGVVDPVCVDAQGLHYLTFLAPGGEIQSFHLRDNGYELDGDILIEAKEGSR